MVLIKRSHQRWRLLDRPPRVPAIGLGLIPPPSQVVEKLQQYAEAGVERFMLQIYDYDDLEVLARDVMPQIDRN